MKEGDSLIFNKKHNASILKENRESDIEIIQYGKEMKEKKVDGNFQQPITPSFTEEDILIP